MNTGSNMTLMMPPSVISSFPDNLDEKNAYVVALSSNTGLTIGSSPLFGYDQ